MQPTAKKKNGLWLVTSYLRMWPWITIVFTGPNIFLSTQLCAIGWRFVLQLGWHEIYSNHFNFIQAGFFPLASLARPWSLPVLSFLSPPPPPLASRLLLLVLV
jgi:hypothetical protein